MLHQYNSQVKSTINTAAIIIIIVVNINTIVNMQETLNILIPSKDVIVTIF